MWLCLNSTVIYSMKVINLDKNFCKELVQTFHKDLYCKLRSEPEVEEESHISEWLQSMITSQSFATVCSGTLEFRRNFLVLVDSSVEEPTPELDATQIFGGVVLEYYEQFNCGVVKFLEVLPSNKKVHKDQTANCRLLMEEAFSVFIEYSKGVKFEVFSRSRKPDFVCAAKNKEILKRQQQLYEAGFRLVKLQSFGNALGDTEVQQFYTHHVLTVYQPQLVPNYQVENGITSGFVPGESVMNICKIFNSPVGGDQHLADIEVFSIFPWWDHLGLTPESQIAVVGAGVAGLAAAASLCQSGYKVVLLEASNYIGGRVKQVQPFDGFPPIDLGGEFIHGSDSIINKLAKKNNWRVTPGYNIGEDDVILYLNGRLHPMRQDNPEVQTAYKAWDEIVYFAGKQNDKEKRKIRTAMDALVKAIGEEQCQLSRDECLQAQTVSCVNQIGACELTTKQTAKDRWSLIKSRNSNDSCVYNWLVENSYSAQVIDIIDAKEGQSWATSLKSLGVCESSREEDNWCYGSENFRLEGSYSQLVKHYLDDCEMVEKRLNWQVKDIIWKDDPTKNNMSGRNSQESMFIKNQHGETLEARYAIVTVPLTVLKDDDIQFIPSLPAGKQIAISSIHMGGALKIVCRFTKPFWPPSFGTLLAVSGFISQIWFYSRDPVSRVLGSEKLEGDKCHLATGFATDEWADRIRHMEEEQLCRRFLQQLDEMFRSENDAMPASGSFISHVYYDWNKNPYVRGGYSSPTAHACGMREELAKPLDDRIFFAGEATNVRVASTVQAAIETGMRAAEEVCRACERKESRADVFSS